MWLKRRCFSIRADEAVTVLVGRVAMNGAPYFMLSEDPDCLFKGALKSHYERIATMCYVETVLRGLGRICPRLRFVYQKPPWTNGQIRFNAEWYEVEMDLKVSGYQNGRWRPLTNEEVSRFSAEQQKATVPASLLQKSPALLQRRLP
jgi:hypothetical protein